MSRHAIQTVEETRFLCRALARRADELELYGRWALPEDATVMLPFGQGGTPVPCLNSCYGLWRLQYMTASEILDWVQVIGNRPAATFTYPDNHVEVEGYTVPCVDCPEVSEAYYPGGNGAPSPFTSGSGSDASFHSSMPSLASGGFPTIVTRSG